MKKTLALLLWAAFSSQAAVIHFNLSPPGTDFAAGLSPSNQVPAVTNSTGSGDVVAGGIQFDTATSILQLAIGYGSAAGFTDMSGPPTAMDIHGPAATNQNASPIVSLLPFNFTAANPTNGGVIFGSIAVSTNAVSNLLAGLDYVSINTALNTNGEIRGQLIPLTNALPTNSPPTITCPPASTVECGKVATATAVVSDADGDALQVVWTLNGNAVQTNTVPSGNSTNMTEVSLMASFPLGTNHIGIQVTDSATNTVSCSTTITVVDTTPPVISNVRAAPNVLWPPNHQMVQVRIGAVATDTCGSATWKIIGVTSNEAENMKGSGHTAPDWTITGDHIVKLRAERSGTGNGRIYTITVQAKDESGNLSEAGTVTVKVPKSQGKSK